MATGSCLLLALPTELRDHIYILASERPTGSRLILKQWFEKVDVSIDRLPPRTSTTTSNPPLANDDVDADEEEDSATSGDEEDANDAGESENDSEEEHIDEDDAMTDAESQEVPVAAGDTQSVDAEVTMIDEGSENDITEANAGSPDDHNEQVEDDLDSEHDENAGSDNESDVDDGEDGEEVEEEENGEAKDAEEDESDESDEESDGVAAPSASAPPSYGRNTKYRHMLPLLELSHPPPPIELLQLCKQVESEAINRFRNTCVLTINVNRGWQHFSFYNETMNMLITAPFSPLEHLRKLRLVIAWDSEWLREKTTPPDNELEESWFFAHYLSERLQVMRELVKACPELKNVEISWHDTEDSNESRNLMIDKLADLQTEIASKIYIDRDDFPKCVELEVKEHFSQAGTPHARNSVLALHRAEFDAFLQDGLVMR